MANFKGVTHEEVKMFVQELPKVWRDELSQNGLYFRTQKTTEHKSPLILIPKVYGEQNNYVIQIPVRIDNLYDASSRKRLSLSKIDKILYPAANHVVQKANAMLREQSEPRNNTELLKANELVISQYVTPLVWVSHDDSVSTVFHMGKDIPGVPKQYLRDGYSLETYIKDFIVSKSNLKGPLHIGFDSENGMFCMYADKTYAYDLYLSARAFSEYVKKQGR